MNTNPPIKVDYTPTGNFWIDNGLVHLLIKKGPGIYPANDLLRELRNDLLQPTGKMDQYYDQNTKQLVTYPKLGWIAPASHFIKVNDTSSNKISVAGKEYRTAPANPELNLKYKSKIADCEICGTHGLVVDTSMWIFPMVAAVDKFGNFYSGSKKGTLLCPRCAVAGVACYLSLLWVVQGRQTLHIFLFHGDLKDLELLRKEVIDYLKLSESKAGNVKLPFYGDYPHETILALLLELFSHIGSSKTLSDERRKILASIFGVETAAVGSKGSKLSLYCLSGSIEGTRQVFKARHLSNITQLHALYKLYEGWIAALADSQNPKQALTQVFRQFTVSQKQREETIWREKIAWAILEFSDPLPYVEDYLFEGKLRSDNKTPLVWGTVNVIDYYCKEVLSMEEKLIKVLMGFGSNLGKQSAEKKDMSVLYALRNAKNVEEYLKVLNDAQFRFEMMVPREIVELQEESKIFNTPWVRVKTLLSIYAMNSYLRTLKGGNEGQGGEKDE
ncbi:hypothetical protein [Pseudothermotoga thermarum]|uniref:Uncharacterized protein n=1 Tax=Pseudothermotoga thermarum DSM 5069 TaxID=688269 RepID=F7YTK8_9THEM|nr:hypothetical protein [Pseudothermotoga thermarum]AEH51230.1 hypothetical protein Theth_1157 [Pseudothermotoga thermarum DSM 5069]